MTARWRTFNFTFCGLLLLGFTTYILAEGTRTWEQSKFDEFVKGTAQGVAMRSAGGLELAPASKQFAATASTYIWSIAAENDGTLYVAAGSPARIYRITAEGKSSVIFEPQELQVQALVIDKSGAIYAATNPDGKVYRVERRKGAASEPAANSADKKGVVDSGWAASVYYDPGTKYIWDLALDKAGSLFVATGDHGEIFKVTGKEHYLFFKSDEAHIRVLRFDPKGNLIAGSDGSGLIYRISPRGEGFVLYSAPKKEITALAIDATGNIYAAGVGEKRTQGASSPPLVALPMAPPSGAGAGSGLGTTGGISLGNQGAPAVLGSFPAPGAGAAGGSEIYRIASDNSPSRLWASREDLVYALAFDRRGTLVVGTGNRGHIFAVSGEDTFTDLLKANASQVTAFAGAPGGGLYAATSNLGKILLLSADSEPEGSFESDVFDAHIFSRWGRTEFRGEGKVELFARSGNVDNPDRNWTPWKKVDLQGDTLVDAPAARFIQWKAILRTGTPAARLDSVRLNYLPKNVAPDFDEVTVQAGIRYQSLPHSAASAEAQPGGSQPRFDPPPPGTHDRDSIGVKWTVHDDNDDQLTYSVYYRAESEKRWLLLKDRLTDRFYSFEASQLPDGDYVVKVVASDAPSHSAEQALSAEKESARFSVDTTPPQVEAPSATLEGSGIHVAFRASDSFSPIKRAEYSVDAGDWQFLEPVGQLSDAKTESYDFRVPLAEVDDASTPSGKKKEAKKLGDLEHVIVVRVYDRFDNMRSAKAVIRGK